MPGALRGLNAVAPGAAGDAPDPDPAAPRRPPRRSCDPPNPAVAPAPEIGVYIVRMPGSEYDTPRRPVVLWMYTSCVSLEIAPGAFR
ncbi:hypothetical protein GCM10009799_22840 [Nocardiopsis rhodophaea]|uniref:Uncharacterized protein n=1 Tax=Nocardiopsis rhodophaea TaxID=280238 RepID=A0ABP5EF65_9ACTN